MAGTRLINADGIIITVNNPIALAAMQTQGYTLAPKGSKVATPKKKVNTQNTTVAAKNREKRKKRMSQQNIARAKAKAEAEAIALAEAKAAAAIKQSKPWTVRDQLAGNAKISEATNVPFNQYMQMRRLAAKYPENRAYQNIVAEMTGKDGQHSRVQFDANNQFGNQIADMEATFPKGSRNSNTVPYNNMDTLAQGKGMVGLGIYRTDASKDIYRPRGYNVPSGNYGEAGTYNVGIDGVVRDNTVSNTTPEAVYTATGQTFSDDGGNASGVVKEPYVAPAPKQTFQQWNANSLEDNLAQETPEGPDMRIGNQFGYHKEPGQNFWDVDDTDPYWNNRVMGTGGAWSHADLKKPIQEVDFSGFADWWRKNVGK